MANTNNGKRPRNVADIIDLAYLQQIQDSLGKIVGITTVLLDPLGVPVTQPTNLQAFCAMMQASESGVQMCISASSHLLKNNQDTRKPVVDFCPNSGMKTAAVPIFLADEYLGSWLIGQIAMDQVDYKLIEQTSEQAGLSKTEARANMELLPVVTDIEFENILNFLTTITKTLTDLVEVNATLQSNNQELTKLTEKLDSSLMAFKDFINFTDIGTYLLDYHTGELLLYNETYKNLIGLSDKELEGTKCYLHMGNDSFCDFCPRAKLLDENGEPTKSYVWEHYNTHINVWLRITSRALRWIDGRMAVIATFLDITDRKKEEERVAYLAYHDQRLDMPNGLKLYEKLKDCAGANTFMICLDIQGLRKINDVYSREAGDLLLHNITSWLKNIDNANFSVFRIDGDDFAGLLTDSDETQAMALAKKIYARFEEPWVVDMVQIKQKMYAGAHMSVLNVPIAFESHSSFLNTIERVLSTARKENILIFFDEEMDNAFKQHDQFEMSLKNCVLNGMLGFSLNYQPIAKASSGKWQGLEALCRWNSPDIGVVPPDVFIYEAERMGLIHTLSDWVFEEAIRQIKEWGLDKNKDFMLDINLSPLQLNDNDLLDKVKFLLKKYKYPPEKLSMEITESAEIHFDEKTITLLEQIRAAGISLSLDDFGIGYAGFSNLRNLPINTLKTDRSFVTGIEEDAFLQHTVRIMVDLAHAADMLVIAEGVETETQQKIMQYNGVNLIQGYYYSRPLSVEEMQKHLDKFRA